MLRSSAPRPAALRVIALGALSLVLGVAPQLRRSRAPSCRSPSGPTVSRATPPRGPTRSRIWPRPSRPAVVNIKVERKQTLRGGPEELFEEFFGQRKPGEKGERKGPRQFSVPSTGSGFVVSADGLIVTNNHVVENAEKMVAVFDDGTELEAKVVGRDPKTDLALIKVESAKALVAGSARRLRGTARGQLGDGDRQPVRARSHRDRRDPLREGPLELRRRADRRTLRRLPADRREHQPRQLRRPADRHEGPRGRHQHGDRGRAVRASASRSRSTWRRASCRSSWNTAR